MARERFIMKSDVHKYLTPEKDYFLAGARAC
jgi:hypothetical protein